MSGLRYYRGLHGEVIPVAEDTIAPAPRIHTREPFPFASAAARLGDRRDTFASVVRHCPWIDDAMELKSVRCMLTA